MVPDTVRPVWQSMALALSLNKLLQELDLSDCGMGSEGLADLVTGLVNNATIHTVRLAGNHLGVRAGASLQRLLRNNASITHLDLADNGLQDGGLIDLAAGIAATLVYNTSLRCLNLRNNAVSVDGALALSVRDSLGDP
jgi:Ran GTPase-activating protein (RanGAP) involved in mRNA processing and transport